MHKSRLTIAVVALFSCASAFAQVGSRDGTNNVASDRIGTPGPGDALTQYQNQRALNNLPSGDNRSQAAKLGPARPAKPGDLIPGAMVNDNTGIAMAKIDTVDKDGVTVSIGTAKVKIPADAFGRNRLGLLLDMTKAQFEQVVAKANANAS